jgi:hypothetical protein
MPAAIETEQCSIPACERAAVAVVRQQDGGLFPVCERHVEKAAALGFPIVWPTGEPSASEDHDRTQPRVAVGDAPPEIRLTLLDRASADGIGEIVDVSAIADGRPVALVFGSYSVPKFRKHLGAIEDLYRWFADRVCFFLVYTKEIQPRGAERARSGQAARLFPENPTTLDERAALARRLVHEFGLSLPVLLDGLDHEVTRSFGAFPMRLYLIGRDGRIAYQGALGPYAFQPAELEAAIQDELG